MSKYEHSVYLDASKCNGCTTCLKHCPTEAIRIREGHAVINQERCIDCGECIRVCPNSAKKAKCSELSAMDSFKWKIALPAPALYTQFDNLNNVDYILDGLLKIGFDDVFEVSAAAEIVSAYTKHYLKNSGIEKPIINSACPAIVRLITLRFPSLKNNILNILPPMEVAASLARDRAKKLHPELKDEEIGVCFISPCPAKASYVNNGFADYKSKVDCVVPIKDIYFKLLSVMKNGSEVDARMDSGVIGVCWASAGGEATAILQDDYIAADGIDNCIKVLDQIENGNVPNVEFVELNACTGGCVGGVLTIENPYVAKARLRGMRRYMSFSKHFIPQEEINSVPTDVLFSELPTYDPITRLSPSLIQSMWMMSEINKIREDLPGIDCGSCGAPTCRAFAEDIVKNEASVEDCPIKCYRAFKEKNKK